MIPRIVFCTMLLLLSSTIDFHISKYESPPITSSVNGRSGPDAEVVSILAPRATTIDSMTGEKMFTLKTGEDVTFEAFITNAGDTAITEMGVSVTVYLAENGVKGLIAKDESGNDLSWTNGDVVCDDTFVCPWASLAAGDNLDNGNYTMSYQGSPATWTPITGDYVIVVQVMAVGDSDPGNDEAPQDHFVSVVDWTDIIVDLAWDSGKEVEGGSGDKAFTLTVGTGGSSSWSARNVTLEMVVTGTLDSATGPSGEDLMGTTQVSGFGTYVMTEVFRHAEDASNHTNESRFVIGFENESTWHGSVVPDMSGDSGDYSIEVNLISYVMYGQLPDCERVVIDRTVDPPIERTYIDYCEVSAGSDDVAVTSEDLLEGKVQTYHDIGVTGLAVNQGYTVDENGNALDTPTMPGMTSGPLHPAWSSVQASVRHLGSDLGVTYDWEVTFDIENTVTGVIHTEVADSCTFGFGQSYDHMMLGDDPLNPGTAFESGEACIMFEFVPGVYTITATASMTNIGQTDDGTGTMVDDYSDMSSSNDNASIFKISALNNRPQVNLILETQGEIIIGPEGTIELTAVAYDFDDPSGLSLLYIWTHPGQFEGEGGVPTPSNCNGLGPLFSTCELIALDSDWAGTNTYSVRVYDVHNSTAQDFMNIAVWNHVIAQDDSTSGIEMIYDLTYRGSNEFGVSIEDSTADAYTRDLSPFGYAGEYTSVAILDYEPSAVYMAQDVYAQSMTINYDASALEPTGVFWVSSNGHWAQLDSTISFAGDDGTIAIDLSENGQVLPQGSIALMGGVLQIIEAPSTYPIWLSVWGEDNGDITATWSYAGTAVPGVDWLSLEICDSEGACDTTQENTTLYAHTLSGQTYTTHGLTYTYTLQVCNTAGCHPINASGSAIANHQSIGNADEDQDGVLDGEDICPNTSTAIIVDDSGCPIDYDGDGVSYLIDDCPNTPNGITVDSNGCPLDSDSDGIANYNDDCPNTTQGLVVDGKGCPVDPDEDGFTNSIDDCPDVWGNSTKGQHTTALIGCMDKDGDGWADSIDRFPLNAAEWLDSDNDGCGDNSDAFPQDPEECIDTDEDGYGDNIDTFPEDPKEFSDKDNDGIGDSSDKCEASDSEIKVDPRGCEIEEGYSSLVIGLVSGVSSLLLVVIALLVIILRRSGRKSNDNSISVYHDDSMFSEDFDSNLPIPAAETMPSANDYGQVSSDGYEWLESPANSGDWYWRETPGTQWNKHQK